MATIKIPPVLRASVGGEREVSAPGANVGEVLKGGEVAIAMKRQH